MCLRYQTANSIMRMNFNFDHRSHRLNKLEIILNKNLQGMMTIDKPDILYYMLQCLNVLCLYGDAFNTAVKDHQGFFIWCQENLLIKK